MSENKTVVENNGIGFWGLLAVVFITLKLTSYIDWPWYWVLAPLWIPWAVSLGFIAVGALIYGLITLAERWLK